MSAVSSSYVFVSAWFFRAYRRIVLVSPLVFLVCTFLSLSSQLFQLVAFLLPLKVMILLGSNDIPNYFPEVIAGIERERLILILAGTAVFLYLMHLFVDFIGVLLTKLASVRLISPDAVGEEVDVQQKKIVLDFYRGLVTIASGLFFVSGVFSFLCIFNFDLFLLIFLYISIFSLLGLGAASWFPFFSARVLNPFSRVIDVLSALGFLLVFGFLVFDFLYYKAEGLLLGILSLLLCRQMFSRLAMALKTAQRIYSHKDRYSFIFTGCNSDFFMSEDFGGDIVEDLHCAMNREAPMFWEVVNPDSCMVLIRQALLVSGKTVDCISVNQLDSGAVDEISLHLICRHNDGRLESFLFNLYSIRKAKEISRSSVISPLMHSSAVNLNSVVQFDGGVSYLYEWSSSAQPVKDLECIYLCRERVFIDSCVVPSSLISPECLKGVDLSSRFNTKLWERCKAFSRWLDPETCQLVDSLYANRFRIKRALSALPLCLYNPEVVFGNVYILEGFPRVLNWGQCTLEPIGSGWPLELGLERLDQAFERARNVCDELRSLTPFQVRLAALAFAFDERCSRWAYLEAFELLGDLSKTLEKLD